MVERKEKERRIGGRRGDQPGRIEETFSREQTQIK
jgi:hypothetical protein